MIRQTLWFAIGWAVAATLAPIPSAEAQDQFYTVRTDPTLSDDHVAASNPQIDDKPFWVAAERFVNSYGFCKRATDEGPDRVNTLNLSEVYSQISVAGFGENLGWFKAQGLYPFGNIGLEIDDPRAPRDYPIFCTLSPNTTPERKDGLRPLFYDYDLNANDTKAVFMATVQASEETLSDRRRIFLGTGWALGRLWEFGSRIQADVEAAPPWLLVGAVDALAVVSTDAAGRLYHEDYDDIRNRLPFLAGDYSERLTNVKDEEGEDQSRGAFVRYLIEHQMSDDWQKLQPMLAAAGEDEFPVAAVHDFVNANDGDLLRGLEHAFPSFAAYQASLGFDAPYNEAVSAKRWLDDSFGGCRDVTIDETVITTKEVFKILPYAASCFVLRIEAKHASWHGDLQIRLKQKDGRPGDDRIDDVILSAAGRGKGSLDQSETACFVNVENSSGIKHCIYEPSSQGEDEDDNLQRLHYFPVDERKPGEKPWAVVLVSYVPKNDRLRTAARRPALDVELTFSLDAVIGDPGDLADMGSSSSGEFELMDMSTASIDHGAKVGLMPIGTKLPGGVDTSWRSIFEGTATSIDGGILEGALASFDNVIQFVDDAGDGFGFMVTDPSVLKPGFTGSTTAIVPFAGKDGYISMPDPEFQGKIEIIENTEDTLHFTAEEGFCMVPMSEWPRLMQETNPDLCEFGERVTAKGKGALAFPPLRRSDTKLEPVETEVYRGLRELRQAKINQTFAFNPQATPQSDPGTINRPGPATPNRTNDAGGVGPLPNMCSVISASGSCDCSCEAKACFDSKTTSSTLTPRESSCKLTCGKRWRECGP